MFEAPISLPDKPMKASWERHDLVFKTPAKTSRETFKTKDTYLLKVSFEGEEKEGVGECSPLWTLSIDPRENYSEKLDWVCSNINSWQEFIYSDELSKYPSIQFGLETALLDLQNGCKQVIFPSKFTRGRDSIEINGLIWMGEYEYMAQQIEDKIESGFNCVKLKIGSIDWEKEKKLLQSIRNRFSAEEIELRVDANGAFTPENALDKLQFLSELEIHSIEQPIMAGQVNEMARLCSSSKVPIALDEELIGVKDFEKKRELLVNIKPQYIILKPSLIGGIKSCNEWINLAEDLEIGWWMTSALEGNIGLSSIAQLSYDPKGMMPQGLGTGQLFESNFEAPIRLIGNKVGFYDFESAFIDCLIESLKRIYSSKNEAIHFNDFLDDESCLVYKKDVVQFLDENEFVEKDRGGEVYCLLPEIYELIESDQIHFSIYDVVVTKRDYVVFGGSEEDEPELTKADLDQIRSENITDKRYWKVAKWTSIVLFVVVLLVVSNYVRFERKNRRQNGLQLNETLLLDIQNKAKEYSDSLKFSSE